MTNRVYVHTRSKRPIPRDGVYELYWTFASRRQAAFERRLAGEPPPWTADPIIQQYKFCNVFRAADRVSQYLISRVAYGDAADTDEDRAFRIVAFRTFSNTRTWDAIEAALGEPPGLRHLASGAFERALSETKARYGGLYTGAFILCANKAYGFDEKHLNHVALFQHMFIRDQLGLKLQATGSLAQVVALLQAYPLMGPFMAYQIAIDLNYSALVNFSENDFVQAGPGALRGLRKAFIDFGDYQPDDVILDMVERQDEEFERLALPFGGLFGRPLHAIDCQGLFCELDKYCREAAPELVSNRTRIKARFAPSSQPLPLAFPPKWGLLPGSGFVPAARVSETQLDLFEDDGGRRQDRLRPQRPQVGGRAAAA
jgi:alpha-glutamyl/putrescinyl thymine pyrophosphorylase clade 1